MNPSQLISQFAVVDKALTMINQNDIISNRYNTTELVGKAILADTSTKTELIDR